MAFGCDLLCLQIIVKKCQSLRENVSTNFLADNLQLPTNNKVLLFETHVHDYLGLLYLPLGLVVLFKFKNIPITYRALTPLVDRS